MILHEILGSEQHPAYQKLEVSNGNRHYDFLNSIILASLEVDCPMLSHTLIKAINYHAIACLHISAGEYRPCDVTVGDFYPPEHYRVSALMGQFVNQVNRIWDAQINAIGLGAYVLWRLNYIHPFINGNGRTARALCYFVVCSKSGGPLG